MSVRVRIPTPLRRFTGGPSNPSKHQGAEQRVVKRPGVVAGNARKHPAFAFIPTTPVSFTKTGPYRLIRHPIYTAYLLTWLAGPVTEVYGKFGVFAHDIEAEDKTVAVLTYANGARAYFDVQDGRITPKPPYGSLL